MYFNNGNTLLLLLCYSKARLIRPLAIPTKVVLIENWSLSQNPISYKTVVWDRVVLQATL